MKRRVSPPRVSFRQMRWRRWAAAFLLGVCLRGEDGRSNALIAPVASNHASASKPGAVLATSAATAVTFDAFRVLSERNIFDPNRVGRVARNSAAAAPRVEVVTLIGVMDSGKGWNAFFAGAGDAYRKPLSPGGAVADFMISAIRPDGVEFTRGTTTLALKVGQQLRRPQGGEWSVGNLDGATGVISSVVDESAIGASQVTSSDASDALRRLMERRQKQLNP